MVTISLIIVLQVYERSTNQILWHPPCQYFTCTYSRSPYSTSNFDLRSNKLIWKRYVSPYPYSQTILLLIQLAEPLFNTDIRCHEQICKYGVPVRFEPWELCHLLGYQCRAKWMHVDTSGLSVHRPRNAHWIYTAAFLYWRIELSNVSFVTIRRWAKFMFSAGYTLQTRL